MTTAEAVVALREKARLLYEGKVTPHRSCGIALAEAFDRATPPYGVLRRGGITGERLCGAVLAAELVLGELLGDPSPTAPAPEALRDAIVECRQEVARRVPRGGAATLVCGDLTARFPVFACEERAQFCTEIVATVAEIVAQIALAHGAPLAPTPILGR